MSNSTHALLSGKEHVEHKPHLPYSAVTSPHVEHHVLLSGKDKVEHTPHLPYSAVNLNMFKAM